MNELVTMEQAEEFAVLDRRDARSVFALAGYVPKPNSRETMLEQLHNAGLDFPVETTPLFANLHGTMQRADAYVAVRNATSGAVFSVAKVTEYADHYQRVRGDASNRADSILFGRAAELKANAVDVIEEIVGELV